MGKELCKYCQNEDECNEDLVSSDLEVNNLPVFNILTYIDNGNELVLMVLDDFSDNLYDAKRMRIHYCPMCGRKLEEKENKL